MYELHECPLAHLNFAKARTNYLLLLDADDIGGASRRLHAENSKLQLEYPRGKYSENMTKIMRNTQGEVGAPFWFDMTYCGHLQ